VLAREITPFSWPTPAKRLSLSSYDAAYVELALRHDIPLATLDRRLRECATKAGVEVL
jgi:predicted nucleic acid-binding protein